MTPETKKFIYSKLLAYLSTRDYSAKKLAEKILLLKKNYPNYPKYQAVTREGVAEVVAMLQTQGFLDERRSLHYLADSWLAGSKGWPVFKLTMIRRGYPRELVEEVLVKYKNQTRDLTSVIAKSKIKIASWHKKAKGDKQKIRMVRSRLYQWLAQRGFNGDDIARICAQLKFPTS